MSDYFPEDYRAAIRERIKKHSEYLSKGKPENFERYKEVVGLIAGLEEALVEFTRCMKMHGENEDD